MKPGKVVFIVLDGVGVGALPDAAAYGDRGANTLAGTARAVDGLHLPNLSRLGLGNIIPVQGLTPARQAEACYGKMAERSAGKDSTTGHWELAGLVTSHPFPLYPKGFPRDVLDAFLAATGCEGVLGNVPASGTEIIKELGEEHIRTGFPIVYTSGDSVFQIAAHEGVIPLDRLYEICLKTRNEVTVGKHAVGRVIARPFIGSSGSFTRTANRRDFALEPPSSTLLDLLQEAGVETVGIGKIDDLFSGRGLKQKIHTRSNAEGVQETIAAAAGLQTGMVMTNLVDFDTLYGHRQDPRGLAKALTEFDAALPKILNVIGDEDVLVLTADHGNDPTDQSTDHSREYVPLLWYTTWGKRNIDLGVRPSFADAGKTVGEYFGLGAPGTLAGNSFLSQVV